MIKRELMKTDESIELSKKIYQTHKELIDFIYENKPDLSDHFIKILKEEKPDLLIHPSVLQGSYIDDVIFYGKKTKKPKFLYLWHKS